MEIVNLHIIILSIGIMIALSGVGVYFFVKALIEYYQYFK